MTEANDIGICRNGCHYEKCSKHGFDLDDETFDKTKTQDFIGQCGTFLSECGVKILAIDLRTDPAGFQKQEFKEITRKYNLKNAQYCQAVFTRSWGGFTGDNPPNETILEVSMAPNKC